MASEKKPPIWPPFSRSSSSLPLSVNSTAKPRPGHLMLRTFHGSPVPRVSSLYSLAYAYRVFVTQLFHPTSCGIYRTELLVPCYFSVAWREVILSAPFALSLLPNLIPTEIQFRYHLLQKPSLKLPSWVRHPFSVTRHNLGLFLTSSLLCLHNLRPHYNHKLLPALGYLSHFCNYGT